MISIDKSLLRQLLAETEGPVLSLYLAVDPRDRENQSMTPQWQIWLKNKLRELSQQADRATWAALQGRLDTYFEGYSAAGRTLVLFMTPDDLYTYELPVRLEHDAAYGQPLLAPLLWAVDEYERYLIIQVDQDRAAFHSAYLGHIDETDRLQIDLDYDWREKTMMPSYSREGTHGSHRDHFEDTIAAHVRRYYRDVADRARELSGENGVDRIILGGSDKSAHAVRELLHSKLAAQVVAITPLPMTLNGHEVLQRVLPLAEEYERQYEAQLLDSVIGLARSEGRGALGHEDVLRALEMQQVELLIVPWPLADAGLAHHLSTLALEQGFEIELVHGNAAARLHEAGGLAARLYYPLPA